MIVSWNYYYYYYYYYLFNLKEETLSTSREHSQLITNTSAHVISGEISGIVQGGCPELNDNSSSIMSDIQPNLQQLVEELQSIRATWQRFGLYLGIKNDDLEAIDENKRNVEDKLLALCCKWTQIKPRGTWKDIVIALEKIKRFDLAESLEEKYIKYHIPSSDTLYDRPDPMSTSLVHPYMSGVTSFPGTTETDDNIETTHVDEREYLMQDMDDLSSQFTYLLTEIQSALKQKLDNKELHLDQLGRYISNMLCIPYKSFCATERRDKIDQLFSQFWDYLSFLHTRLIHRIDRNYLNGKLKTEIERYDNNIDKFTKSTTITAFKEMIQSKGLDTSIPVILKLSRRWERNTLYHLHHLTDYLFEDSSSLLKFSLIDHSVLTIKYTIPRSILLSLLTMASRKVRCMEWAGVVRVQVDTMLMIVSTNETGIHPSYALLATVYSSDDQITNDIHLLVNIGGDVNTVSTLKASTGIFEVTPLILAAEMGNVSSLYALLQLKANPDMNAFEGNTALIKASQEGHEKCVELLLQSKANPDIQDNKGATALCMATQNRHDKCVNLLLQSKADPNIRANNGVTALHIASQNGHEQCVHLLLQSKADPDIQTNNGITALHIASQNGHDKCVDLLLKSKANPDIQDHNGGTALLRTTQNGYDQCVALLLQSKANPDIKPFDGTTALLIASQKGHHHCVDLLLQSKANPDIQNNKRVTALLIASQEGHDKCVELLLQSKANPDIQDNKGATALHMATQNRHDKCVNLLLQSKADPNIQAHNGVTALYIASKYGQDQCVDLLLQSKADPNLRANNGATALYIASKNGQDQCVDLLLQSKADPNMHANNAATALSIARQNRHDRCVDLLLQSKANSNIQTKHLTPLMFAFFHIILIFFFCWLLVACFYGHLI